MFLLRRWRTFSCIMLFHATALRPRHSGKVKLAHPHPLPFRFLFCRKEGWQTETLHWLAGGRHVHSDVFAPTTTHSLSYSLCLNIYSLVCVCAGNNWKTTCSSPSGHYQYNVMLLGLTNPQSFFQTFINLDDIFIFYGSQKSRFGSIQWCILYI